MAYALIATIRHKGLDRLVALANPDPFHPRRRDVIAFVAGVLVLGCGCALLASFWPRSLSFPFRLSGVGPTTVLNVLLETTPVLTFATIPSLLVASACLWHLTDVWKDIRKGSNPVVLQPNDATRRRDSAVKSIKLAHFSDLHLTRAADFATMEHRRTPGGPPPSAYPNQSLRRLIADHEGPLREADALVISGDVTDMGLAEEWGNFEELMPAWLLEKTILVPGNHDLNIVPSDSLWHVEPFNQRGRHIRMLRFLMTMNALAGDRALVWDWDKPVTLRERLARYSDCWEGFSSAGRWPPRAPLTEVFWSDLFPIVIPIEASDVAVAVLDSNAASSSVVTNALGSLPRNALGRTRYLKFPKHLRHYAFAVALHHHVALPPHLDSRDNLKRALERFMVLSRSRELLQALSQLGRCVCLHGHKHVLYQGKTGDIDVCSSASTTLGDEQAGTGSGFPMWEIGTVGSDTFLQGFEVFGSNTFVSHAQKRLTGLT